MTVCYATWNFHQFWMMYWMFFHGRKRSHKYCVENSTSFINFDEQLFVINLGSLRLRLACQQRRIFTRRISYVHNLQLFFDTCNENIAVDICMKACRIILMISALFTLRIQKPDPFSTTKTLWVILSVFCHISCRKLFERLSNFK